MITILLFVVNSWIHKRETYSRGMATRSIILTSQRLLEMLLETQSMLKEQAVWCGFREVSFYNGEHGFHQIFVGNVFGRKLVLQPGDKSFPAFYTKHPHA